MKFINQDELEISSSTLDEAKIEVSFKTSGEIFPSVSYICMSLPNFALSNRDNNDISPAVLEGCGGKQNLIGNLTNNGKFCVYPTFTKINAGLCKIVIENIRTPEKAEKANVSTRLFEIVSLQSYNVIQNVKFFQSPLVQAKIYNATMNLSNFITSLFLVLASELII